MECVISMKKMVPVLMIAMLALVSITSTTEALGCLDVSASLQTCLGILKGGGNGTQPSSDCCAGLRNIQDKDAGDPSRVRESCQCSKNFLATAYEKDLQPTVDADLDVSLQLQQGCGVNLGFSLSLTAEC